MPENRALRTMAILTPLFALAMGGTWTLARYTDTVSREATALVKEARAEHINFVQKEQFIEFRGRMGEDSKEIRDRLRALEAKVANIEAGIEFLVSHAERQNRSTNKK